MKLKLIRLRMDDVGPVPFGATREETEDAALIASLLIAKGHEEVAEVDEAMTRAERVDELADLYEVAGALAIVHGISMAEVRQAADNKRRERGGLIEDLGGGRFRAELLRRPD